MGLTRSEKLSFAGARYDASSADSAAPPSQLKNKSTPFGRQKNSLETDNFKLDKPKK
ncbi:hypothetical protein [Pseudomonas yamanorum]|uniref:hypothetical protein n=1 Tax=Pseudomonas yamanorum TaxID=515393 RepID=UPI003BA20DAB